jgi:CBS domain-containing protein
MTISTLLAKQQYPLAKCHPDNSVLQAAHEMASKKANALAVIANDGKLAGIVTDHDIIRCLVARNRELDLEVVRAWMTPKVITCQPATSLKDAIELMARKRIRHLVVVESSRAIGVVGIRELLAAAHEEDMLEKHVLRDLVTAGR